MPSMSNCRLIETHVSVIIMIGDRVYKFKKPISFGFVDMTSQDRREAACRDEVSLNSRLAPDVYLGVGRFTMPEGSSEPAVVMRRLTAERCLSVLLDNPGDWLYEQLRVTAETLGRFHSRARRGAEVDAACGGPALRQLWSQNILELRDVSTGLVDADLISWIATAGLRYIDGRWPLFASRVRSGEVVEGHGDLLCSDVFLLDDGPRLLDCLEFDPRLRYLDTAHDVSSLAMDLEASGRPDESRFFLDRYAELCPEPCPASLADFYMSHRAAVRSKVSFIEFARTGADRFLDAAQKLLTLAADRIQSAQLRLVLIGGLPGTGKSTLAVNLGERTGWSRLTSDYLRKRMAGLAPHEDATAEFGTGIYDAAHTADTYSSMLAEAADLLGRGRSVILDASWIRRSWRSAAQELANECGAELVQLRCTAPRAVTGERILARHAAGTDPSDATPSIADAMDSALEPWNDSIEVDSSEGVAVSIRFVLEVLGIGL